MRQLFTSTSHITLTLLLGLYGCSDEADRRDELGIDERENGRYELVPVDGEQNDSNSNADSLQNESFVDRELPSRAERDSVESPQRQEVEPAKEVEQVLDVTPRAVVFDAKGAYTVQIGGYRDAKKAKELVRELSDAGYPAYAIARPKSEEMRVRIGYFKTQVDAAQFGAIFQADHGMDYWVDKKENE